MPKTYDIDGIILNVINPHLGTGGQGRAEQVALTNDPKVGLVVKYLPITQVAQDRTKFLVDKALPTLSPFLAAPIAVNLDGNDEIVHLAPFAPGHDLLSDARTFPENMELAFHLACLMTILEEQGIAHGDIAPSNIIITNKGEVYLIDFDNFASTHPNAPAPTMGGWGMMMAPELRGSSGHTPDIESDRFAAGIIYNILIMRRHPADAARVPSDMKMILTSGIWPERTMSCGPDDVPIEALGDSLPALFDAAFSLDPNQRPSADKWRRAFGQALHDIVIHDCGNAFVITSSHKHCPWCQVSIEGDVLPRISQLKVTIPTLGTRYGLTLHDGQPIILGRGNLGGQKPSVSGRHLEITPIGQRVFLRHIGRNPTRMLKGGQWHNLHETWVSLDDMALAPIALKLADLHIDISV